MRWRMGRAWLIVFLFIIFCFAHTVFAAEASRIELKDGKVYEKVTFTVDNQYKVIIIKTGGWKREVSFTDVAYIYDENGKDVTADCLGGYYTPPEKSQGSEQGLAEKPTYKSYRKRPFNFGFSGGTNYSFPTGDYYYGIKSGVGFGFEVIIPVTKEVAIRGTISKSGMKDDLKKLFPGFIILEDNFSLNAWRYSVSGQYYKWPKWKTGGKLLYYAYAGLGVISHKFSGTALIQDPQLSEVYVVYPIKGAQNKFIMTYGGGVVAMVSNAVGIEAGLSLDNVIVGKGYSNYDTFVFDLKIGLVTIF